MSEFAKSLKRLFLIGKITEERLSAMVFDGKITTGEQMYIITPPSE